LGLVSSKITEEVLGRMAEGERATGTPNTIYDLSSVLFHALEGGASYDTYIEDAQREGDQELAEFFRQVRDEDSNRADRAQQLLAERTPTAGRAGGATSAATAGTEPPGVPPTSEGAPATGRAGVGGTEGTLPPVTEEVAPTTRETPPRTEEGPLGREGRDPLGREDPLDREEREPLGREDPLPREEREPLGREDQLPREEREPLGREDPLPREERASLGKEDPLPREERASLGREDPVRRGEESRETEREEDKGLIDKALDKLSGGGDEERRER
jgi:hypothetical protein